MKNHFLNPFKNQPTKMLGAPGAVHPDPSQGTNERAPMGQRPPPVGQTETEAELTGRLSPTVSQPAVRSPPAAHPRRGEHGAPREGTGGARNGARWRAWRSGGAAHRRSAISGHGKARGGAHEVREGKAVLTRAKGRREVERRGGVHGSGALR